MRKAEFYPALQADLAAALFGISTPLAKVLLGNFQPVTLAAFLYLGSGIGLSFFLVVTHLTKKQIEKEASLPKKRFALAGRGNRIRRHPNPYHINVKFGESLPCISMNVKRWSIRTFICRI